MCIYIYIYIHIYTCVYIYIYIYTYIYTAINYILSSRDDAETIQPMPDVKHLLTMCDLTKEEASH